MTKTSLATLVALTLLASPWIARAQGDGPCALLTIAEVQQAFPGAPAGRPDRKLEKQGILRCTWNHPAGTLILIDSNEDESAKDAAAGLTPAFLDPLNVGASRHVRYESLPGIGDEAVAVVERQDKSKGIAQDGAILVVRRGKRQVVAMSSDLARRDRTEALRVFTELAKAIAKRLG